MGRGPGSADVDTVYKLLAEMNRIIDKELPDRRSRKPQ
jgi:hypothetical protein